MELYVHSAANTTVLTANVCCKKWPVSPPWSSSSKPRLEMWAKAQRDGRPAEYGWRPMLNAAQFG